MMTRDDAEAEENAENCERGRRIERAVLECRDERMNDQRRGEKMQPEGNVGAPRLPLRVRHVEAHGQCEDAEPAR